MGHPWNYIEFHRSLYEIPGNSMKFHGIPWTSMEFRGVILHGFSHFPDNHWVVSFIVYAFYTTTFLQLGVDESWSDGQKSVYNISVSHCSGTFAVGPGSKLNYHAQKEKGNLCLILTKFREY